MAKEIKRAFIVFLICFVGKWFKIDICTLFVPFVFLYWMAFLGLIDYVVYTLVIGIKRIKKYKFKAITPFIISFATFLFVTVLPVQDYRLRIEYYCFKPVRDKIVEEIKESDVTYIDKEVKLPWYLSFVSADGKIIVEKHESGITVSFKFFNEIVTSRSSKVVYSSEDIEEREYRAEGEYGKIEKLGRNWYYIQEQIYD